MSKLCIQADNPRLVLHTGLWPLQMAAWALLVGSGFAMPNAVLLGYGQARTCSPCLALQVGICAHCARTQSAMQATAIYIQFTFLMHLGQLCTAGRCLSFAAAEVRSMLARWHCY